MKYTIPQVAKAIVAGISCIVTVGGILLSSNLLHGTAQAWVTTIVAICGTLLSTFATFKVPNAKAPLTKE